MRSIAVFTTTRAEFGLFYPLIKAIEKAEDLQYLLFVGGTHLANEHGMTVNEIIGKNVSITDTFDYLLNQDTYESIARSAGIAINRLSEIFCKYNFDFVCVLGDRFELLSIVQCAILFKKPIIHIHGGESSEGAIDEQIRHMITKASHIHFVAYEEYKLNVRKMGESDWRIFNTGALSSDNMMKCLNIDRKKLFLKLGLNYKKKTVLMTYHPVTLEYKISPLNQIENIFKALDEFDFQAIITSPNIEVDRDKILFVIQKEINQNHNYHYIESLGVELFHSLVFHSEFVIGNSSSGIIEVPFFRIPTVNVGDRQKGRLRHESIIDTDCSVNAIRKGIEKALSKDFRKVIKTMGFKFGDGNVANKMVKIIKSIDINEKLMRKELDFPNE